MKTIAAILVQIRKPLVIDEIEIPRLRAGQVLVQIIATGICRAQLNELKGWKGRDKFIPHLLGHEAVAIVVDKSPQVRKVKAGDTVVCTWIKGAGIDAGPTAYTWGRRTVNSGPIATFSKFAVLSENRVIRVSAQLSAEVGALLGCAIPTGIGIIRNALSGTKYSSVAIFGVGGVGASALLGAKTADYKTIIALDITPEKLRFAKKIGATHVIHASKEDVRAAVRRITTSGVDFAVEASGAKSAMEAAFDVISDRGTVVVAGNLKLGEKISLDPFGLIKGKRLLGSWGGETDPDRDIAIYAREIQSGKLRAEMLVTRVIRLEDVNRALSDMEHNKVVGRTIIRL